MTRLALILAALGALSAAAGAQATTPADAAFQRAAALVRDGQGEAGRQIVDSIFVRTRTGTPEHAEALYWRAALAMDAQQAEGDYRRLVVEYPLSPRVERGLLALAQLEIARNDRERALTHLRRIAREHPAGTLRASAAFWTARVRFDMNDAPRACAALDEAQRLASADDVELRNQITYYAGRCRGVERIAEADAPGSGSRAATPPADDAATRNPPSLPPAAGEPAAGSRTPPAAAPAAARAPVPAAGPATPAVYAVQVAAYDTAAEAEALVRRLRTRNVVARVSGTTRPFRVRTGRYATRAEANAALRDLRSRGIHGFIVNEAAAASP